MPRQHYELTGPTEAVLRQVPVGAHFRYKKGKTRYVMLPDGEFQNATKPGGVFWANSLGGQFDNLHTITTLVVEKQDA